MENSHTSNSLLRIMRQCRSGEGMVKDIKRGKSREFIATKFHNSMGDIIVNTTKKLSKRQGIKDIALSGGVFQNKFLRAKVMKVLFLTKTHYQ